MGHSGLGPDSASPHAPRGLRALSPFQGRPCSTAQAGLYTITQCMHTHAHTHAHAHTHTHTHTRTHTHTHTHTHTCTRAHTHTRTHTHSFLTELIASPSPFHVWTRPFYCQPTHTASNQPRTLNILMTVQ